MAILPIKTYGDPVLRKKAQAVKKAVEVDKKFIEDMVETMYAKDGVGLAATQVGVSKRICVISASPGETLVVINPKILKKTGSCLIEEGCLSVPGINAEVRRAKKLKVSFCDLSGREIKMDAEGLLARVIQHETDHLDGILFIDRLGFLKRRKILKKLRKCA